MTVDVRSAPDADLLARDAAELILASAVAAVRERGRCCLAVSGGSTPAKLFAALAELEMPWADIHVFQVDERIAPLGDPDRNLGDLAANLLERVPIPWRNVHLMPVDAADPAVEARSVDDDLERTCAGVLDLVHLGLGDDGHTASWPPGHAEVAAWTSDVGMTTPFNGRSRLTLTPRAVNRARVVLWLVSGATKAPLVRRLLAGDSTIPAGLVTVERQVLFADAAALG